MLTRPDLTHAIGRTPLVRLPQFEPRAGVRLFAKLEAANPAGSVKDRPALAMIRAGERAGALGPGKVLIDASSGNTAIAYAAIAAARGHAVELCVPANASPERLRILRLLGAELVLTDPMGGTDAAILEARRRATAAPDRYFYPDQYSNPLNWQAHFDTTGVEILDATRHRVTHFVAGLGTSGTFTGVGRRLRQTLPSVSLISVQPDSAWHGLEGLKHMPSALVPPIYDPSLADRNIEVGTDEALALTRRLAREAGLFVGPSSGAALAGALAVAADLSRGTVVTVFPDGGERYLSESWWDEVDGLAVPASVLRDIARHARETYPDECCGALIGAGPDRVAAALPLDNTTSLERQRRFLVSPEAYRAAEAHADATGRRLMGFYHSHPDHPAVPSAFDLEQAWPHLSYLIAPVSPAGVGRVRSWRLRADRSGFREEPVQILQGAADVRQSPDSHSTPAVHRAGVER